MQVALDPASDRFALWRLAVGGWFHRPLLRALAANPGAPKPLLRVLALRRWDVQAAVAANPRCPRKVHEAAAYSPEWAVRAAVASNPAAAPEILEKLIRGSDAAVRLHVAANPSLTQVLVDLLLTDRDPYVRAVAAAHPVASAAWLHRLGQDFSEPAWTLRAIAANPSCPAELSDQLLTWIALGAAGHDDPLFDPVECTGHPGDTRFTPMAWYLEQASGAAAEHHPLWRVRAAVMRAAGRISAHRARVLARDPRPEVRRTIAGLGVLPLDIRLELRHDADPQVARFASASFGGAKGAVSKKRLARWVRNMIPLAPVLVVALIAVQQQVGVSAPQTPGRPAVGQASRTAHRPGKGQPQTGLAIPAMRALPGGGSIMCGLLSSSSDIAFVSVTAGSRELTLHVRDAVTVAGRRAVPDPLTVPAGRSIEFLFPSGPSRVGVTTNQVGRGSPKVVVTLPRCGG
jgi:hypothetical protein